MTAAAAAYPLYPRHGRTRWWALGYPLIAWLWRKKTNVRWVLLFFVVLACISSFPSGPVKTPRWRPVNLLPVAVLLAQCQSVGIGTAVNSRTFGGRVWRNVMMPPCVVRAFSPPTMYMPFILFSKTFISANITWMNASLGMVSIYIVYV